MKKTVLVLLLVLPLAVAVRASQDSECDMAKIERGLYCEMDDQVLTKADLVSDAKYLVCKDCGAVAAEKGTCEICDGEVVEKTSGKNVCKHCYEKPIEVEFCVKQYYECPDCGEGFAKAGKCADCETALESKTSRALIVYVCEECGEQTYKAGKCRDKECENFGKPLTKTCSESGTFPHVKTGS